MFMGATTEIIETKSSNIMLLLFSGTDAKVKGVTTQV